ncbi:hypothetical protein MPTK1_1g19920 [Marchantia polymorpha subsp. ruderalis]|uniref:Uncharacterized protein n=2 Tax=Marchantia polymorpha TaxID=3197 RepID=A0AAF6AS31_MARPO|nr:hypothetical protein MARPO_0001s0329 [Marchantia polymorpha]BBM99251.1 hypothetical protein Mp_1g19920 [Marchantia polymorpha subsp. ruderalis]|eukprot:PTQ50333.1 hypothetical protein MARPO_0001s0329 [Marchantia polymorpha]
MEVDLSPCAGGARGALIRDLFVHFWKLNLGSAHQGYGIRAVCTAMSGVTRGLNWGLGATCLLCDPIKCD